MTLGIIYKATSPSGKVYIGKTEYSLAKRMGEHISMAKTKDTRFCRAIKKYGDQLEWSILFENVNPDELNWYEVWSIKLFDSYKSGYNSTLGGDGHSGEFTEEHRKSLSENHVGMTGKNHSEETKKKMSETKKGKRFSEQHKKNLSKAFKGRKVSPETREKLRKAALRQWEIQRNGQ